MLTSRADLAAYLAADLAAHGLDRWRPFPHRLTRRTLHFQRLLRHWEYWSNARHDPVGRLVAGWYRTRVKFLGERLGFSIPLNVFGPGLSIAHAGTIVVNERTVVGSNCRIHQVVTLGEANGLVPRLGDGVHLSPHVAVIGGVTIGDRVGVRTGAVVVHDVPDDVDVAGVPARVVGARQDR